MKDIFKRISVSYYISLLTIIIVPFIYCTKFKNIQLNSNYITFLICLYILSFIVIICGIIDDVRNNKNLKTLIGIPSSDYEVEVFDCTAESFKNYIGEEPDETSESCFYTDLYMIYRIPITEHMRNLSENDNLLKIKVSYKGAQSVKKLKQKAIKRIDTNGYNNKM